MGNQFECGLREGRERVGKRSEGKREKERTNVGGLLSRSGCRRLRRVVGSGDGRVVSPQR